jgi:DNA-binding FadR family transcriptional regulator
LVSSPADRTGPALSQTDVVVEGIKRMILDGALTPGQRLPVEADLASELGVSRGPLREAVRALSLMGVLETRQGAGTYVTALDSSLLLAPMGFLVDLQPGDDSADLHAVRRVLETEAAGLAALHIEQEQLRAAQAALDSAAGVDGAAPEAHAFVEADLRFHQVIGQASGNPVLAALIQAFAGRTARARVQRAIADEGALARTAAEHAMILAALRAHDPDRARVRMANHLLSVEDFLIAPDPLSG